jgi:hypothetical protein
MSNQGGLSGNSRKRKEQWEAKIGLIAKEVRLIIQLLKHLAQELLLLMSLSLLQIPEVPFHIFAATEQDGFRKPRPGMWNNLIRALYSKENVVFGTPLFFALPSHCLVFPPLPCQMRREDQNLYQNLILSRRLCLFVDPWLICSCRFRTMLLCRRCCRTSRRSQRQRQGSGGCNRPAISYSRG